MKRKLHEKCRLTMALVREVLLTNKQIGILKMKIKSK